MTLAVWGLSTKYPMRIRAPDTSLRMTEFHNVNEGAHYTNKFLKQVILLLASHATLNGFDSQKVDLRANAGAP